MQLFFAPAGERAAREALGWQNGQYLNTEFQEKWEQIIRDWSLRWGDKVDGWWFDGCYWPNTMYRSKEPPNFESFAAAARAGNPMSAVSFNPGVVPRLISMTPYEDYTAGEISDLSILQIRRSRNGILDGKQVHVLTYLGRTWGRGEPRFPAKQAIQWSQEVRKTGGVITWDVPVQTNGLISQPFMEQLTAIGQALAPANSGNAEPKVPLSAQTLPCSSQFASKVRTRILFSILRLANAVPLSASSTGPRRWIQAISITPF